MMIILEEDKMIQGAGKEFEGSGMSERGKPKIVIGRMTILPEGPTTHCEPMCCRG
jgi:hypothetical protein